MDSWLRSSAVGGLVILLELDIQLSGNSYQEQVSGSLLRLVEALVIQWTAIKNILELLVMRSLTKYLAVLHSDNQVNRNFTQNKTPHWSSEGLIDFENTSKKSKLRVELTFELSWLD